MNSVWDTIYFWLNKSIVNMLFIHTSFILMCIITPLNFKSILRTSCVWILFSSALVRCINKIDDCFVEVIYFIAKIYHFIAKNEIIYFICEKMAVRYLEVYNKYWIAFLLFRYLLLLFCDFKIWVEHNLVHLNFFLKMAIW